MAVVEVVIIGCIMLGAATWQLFITAKDKKRFPRRLGVAFLVAIVVVLGSIGYAIINALDASKTFSAHDGFSLIGNAILFSVLLCIQAYFAPIVLGAIVSSEIYYLLEYQTLRNVPLIVAPLRDLFETRSVQAQTIYFVTVMVYCLVMLFVDHEVDVAAIRRRVLQE